MNNNENIYALERLTPENSLIELQSNSSPPPVYEEVIEKNIQDFILGQEQIIIDNPIQNQPDNITLTPIFIMIVISWLSPFIGGIYFLFYLTCRRNPLNMSLSEIKAMTMLFISFTLSLIINYIIPK